MSLRVRNKRGIQCVERSRAPLIGIAEENGAVFLMVSTAGPERSKLVLMPLEIYKNLPRNRLSLAYSTSAVLLLQINTLVPSFRVSFIISCCRGLCVFAAPPGPGPWTGSSLRPGTAGGPGPDGARQSGCAGTDCTAALPRWWRDSEKWSECQTAAAPQKWCAQVSL